MDDSLQKVFGTKFVPFKASQLSMWISFFFKIQLSCVLYLNDLFILYYLGTASGTSMDWYKAPKSAGGLGARYVYTIELRDCEGGRYAFLLPEEQIKPSGEETSNFLNIDIFKYFSE